MPKAKKARRPDNIPPPGMKTSPYYRLPYAVIDAALKEQLTGAALRILLLAMKASHNNKTQVHLALKGVTTATKCNRNSVVAGLQELVKCGLLKRLNDRGDYLLGTMFDEFIPDDVVSSDIIADGQSNIPKPESNADRMFSVWNELVDENQRERELDADGRRRAEAWAFKRTDPIADFRMSLAYFRKHGHEVPLEGGDERDPNKYGFKGFLNVCQMFLKHAKAEKDKAAAAKPVAQPDVHAVVPVPPSVANAVEEPAQSVSPDIPLRYASFITGKNTEGKFTYREGPIASAEELALVYEHAFEKVGSPTNMHSKAAMNKCAEDFAGMLKDADAARVVRMIGYAKGISKNEGQQEYFSGRSFNYHTGRTLFGDALSVMHESDAYQAEMIAKEKREIESGERRNQHMWLIGYALDHYARYFADIDDVFAEDWQKRAEEEMSHGLEGLNRDYGDDRTNIPDSVISGLRCLSTFGVLDVPDYFQDAVGSGPWEPTFDWVRDERVKKLLIEKAESVGRSAERDKKDGSGGQFDAHENTLPQDQEGVLRLLKGENFGPMPPPPQKPILPPLYPLNPYMHNSHLLPDDGEQSFD